MKNLLSIAVIVLAAIVLAILPKSIMESPIDKEAIVVRNCPVVTSIDTLASLSVGNGEFAFTADITGLQTFSDLYKNGVPLGTQSQWAWHSFANPENYTVEETLGEYDFGHGTAGLYATEFKEEGRQREASKWHRANPHRLHLGIVGFEGLKSEDITSINQRLDLYSGKIISHFVCENIPYNVETICHPEFDLVAVSVKSGRQSPIKFRFPYPTGKHTDDACDWESGDKHSTTVISSGSNTAILKREIDETVYFMELVWDGDGTLEIKEDNYFLLCPSENSFTFSFHFSKDEEGLLWANEGNEPKSSSLFDETKQAATQYWNTFWQEGAAVDFSNCTDSRAKELERRVVLSQYLLAIQSAGSTPPQETGLTYNSWFGKFHLEMIWWHQAWQPLWGHGDLLGNTMEWYGKAEPIAHQIAERQGFDGVRWMKMTDPDAKEAPSKVGSFLIWQQPHYIYMAELLYRENPTDSVLSLYSRLVDETAKFMYSFADYDENNDRFVLKGIIPAQETLKASETINPPLELSYWLFGLQTAQKWREREGKERIPEWDNLINKLSPLAYNADSLYLAAESAIDTYTDIRFTSDHPAVLGAVGMLPESRLVDGENMRKTLSWIWDNWNWDKTWGWDYPMAAMAAARLGEPEKAVDALLMEKRTNTYLPNGHNYQDDRLRIYLPGNGGLLTAIAMMCAGWDGCDRSNPGFPDNGQWDVRWEGLKPLP